MNRQDNFTSKIRTAVAARSGWRCSLSGCGKLTIGPSEEAPDASASIGEAAHICAASPGGRRYDPNMTREERSDISNAMWLCTDHATLIDRDEVTYTVEKLHRMKDEHETACSRAIRNGSDTVLDGDLFAIGPKIVFTGTIKTVDATSWTLQLTHFLAGDVHEVVTYISEFANTSADQRYVLCNELGDGRTLSGAPTLGKVENGYVLMCPVEPNFPRVDVQKIGTGLAISSETNDLYLDARGNIARVSGLDYFPQFVQQKFSMQEGESVFDPNFGMRFYEYFSAYSGSPWLDLLFKLDVIRQASIPYFSASLDQRNTPLRCVTRVHKIELLTSTPTNNRLLISVDFDVKGLGRWSREISVYMPTTEQMNERKKILASRPFVSTRKNT